MDTAGNNRTELEVHGILNRLPSDYALMVILREKGGNRNLPVLVGPLEAQAIAISLYSHKMPRPGIYELYLNTLQSFDAFVTEVDIYCNEGGVFHSHVFLSMNGNESFVECRTSDAIAIAVRSGVPIFIDNDLLEQYCARQEAGGVYSMPITTASTAVLKEAMEQAVKTENYEFAARLRDEINRRSAAGESDTDII